MNHENIVDIWHSNPTEYRRAYVIPDGCQDVIFSFHPNNKPNVYLSPLYQQTIMVEMEPGTEMMGFRLRAGCEVGTLNIQALLSAFHSVDRVTDLIESATNTGENITEALNCIQHNGVSIQLSANELGVSVRTLQRLIQRNTNQNPSFWLRLARVRQCARALVAEGVHCEVAYQYHYADQAHMCRELKHWFGVTPTQLLKRHDLIEQLFVQAY